MQAHYYLITSKSHTCIDTHLRMVVTTIVLHDIDIFYARYIVFNITKYHGICNTMIWLHIVYYFMLTTLWLSFDHIGVLYCQAKFACNFAFLLPTNPSLVEESP